MKISDHIIFSLVVLLSVVIADISILLNIPVYRQVFGFLLITLIPGLILTQILNLKSTCPSKIILYSVGFSVALTMFLGFTVNLVSPLFAIDKPISTMPLLVALNVAILVLVLTSFVVKPSNDKLHLDLRELFALLYSPQSGFLLLILLLGIVGGLAVRYYICSVFSVIAMFLIAVVVSLVAFDKFFEEKHYAIALFVIGITLLFTRTLTSPYLGGSDIHVELFYQKLTEINGYWDPNIYPNAVNTMLSTVILPTVYSAILGIDTIVVYKEVFSILFALAPAALYLVFRQYLMPKLSFFSVFLFMSFYAFFLVLPWLPRQQIAELFLALLLLTLQDIDIQPSVRSFLTIVWIFSVIVSHYATTYIVLFFVTLVSIMQFAFREKTLIVKFLTTVFAIILTLSWYLYISLATFKILASVIQKISIGMTNELGSTATIDPSVDLALGAGLSNLSFWHVMGHLWQIGTQILIGIGFVYVILQYLKKREHPVLTFFSIVGMLFLFMSIALPFFSSSLNMDRIYHIVLIFISPLCVIGVIYPIGWFARICRMSPPQKQKLISLCLVLVFVPYFLFNSSAVFEVTEKSNNFVLEINTDHSRYFSNESYYFFNQRIPREDVNTCEWIATYRVAGSPVYSDSSRECELWGYGLIPYSDVFGKTYPPTTGGYVFVGRQNIIDNVYICPDKNRVRSSVKYNFDQVLLDLEPRDLVYSSGAAVYK